MLNFSRNLGITYFDNGDAYGNGRAETVFGKWLAEHKIPRDQVEIGSKFGYDFYSDPGEAGSHRERKQDFSPKFIRYALEQSLDRLGVETIDLYMAHNIKLPQFRDDMLAELEKIKDEGKIKVWGVSLGPAIGWREEGVKAMLDHGAKAVQTVFNMFEQNPGREFCETAVATHGGVMARVHDNSSILKDIVKIDTTIDRERPPKIPRPILENLWSEKTRIDSALRHRSWNDRSSTGLQMASSTAGPDGHHRDVPE